MKPRFLLMPATVTISDPECTPNEMDATITLVITVERLTEEEIVGVKVFVNGSDSGTEPEEPNPPVDLGSDKWRHTYHWSHNVPCGDTYSVEAKVNFQVLFEEVSGAKSADCPSC